MLARVIIGPPKPELLTSMPLEESGSDNGLVRVEIPLDLLGSMLRDQQLHVADLRCLDFDSKRSIRRISLDHLQHHLLTAGSHLM